VCELVEALVLDHVEDARARQALGEEGERSALRRDEEHSAAAGRVHAIARTEHGEVVGLAREHEHVRNLRRARRQAGETARVLLVKQIEVRRVELGVLGFEIAQDAVVLRSRFGAWLPGDPLLRERLRAEAAGEDQHHERAEWGGKLAKSAMHAVSAV